MMRTPTEEEKLAIFLAHIAQVAERLKRVADMAESQ